MKQLGIKLLSNILSVLLVQVLSLPGEKVSGWSECSRPCGKGLSRRTVSCLKTDQSCSGVSYRYKLCNTQPCLDKPVDFRYQQCEVFNTKPFHGVIYDWLPVFVPQHPCVLTCRNNVTVDWQTVKFSDKASDGTSCKVGANDICINGKCLSVGCDGIVESGQAVDKCGICGGNKAECLNITKDKYSWRTYWLPCSATCGTGFQKTEITCLEVESGNIVNETSCQMEVKPHAMTMECFKEDCTKDIHVCEDEDCPKWVINEWSLCPVTCGQGYQVRKVYCKDGACPVEIKPISKRVCHTGMPCTDSFDNLQTTIGADKTVPFKHQKRSEKPRYSVGSWSGCSTTCGRGIRSRLVECHMISEATHKIERLKDEECHEEVHPEETVECTLIECPNVESLTPELNETWKSSEPLYTWIVGNYGECSKSCLGGEQYPALKCVNNGRSVNLRFCSGLTHPVIQSRICNDNPCPPRWDVNEYGPCTAECGGGVQERPVECIEELSEVLKVPVDNYRCIDPIPMSTRNCNSHFCPAMWMTKGWSECSSSCGVGLQTRRAYCVKSPIAGRQVTVSDTECMGPKPLTSRECHLGKCFGTDSPPPVIKSENYTYVQFRRSKRVKLIVGGKVILLPGQSTIIKCPVKHFQRKLIFWSKGYKLIPMMAGRIHTTFSGNLKLRKTNPELDAGSYTCSAGFQSASVTIEFQSKREATKKAKEMQKLLSEANKEANLILPINDEAAGPGIVRDGRYNHTKQLVFTAGPWSTCSRTCGYGQQTREVKCTRITHKYMKMLNKRECIKWGLRKPEEIKKCLIRKDCPSWEIGNWTRCNKKQCVRDGYGQKKRPIHCIHSNGTRAIIDTCQSLQRPEHKMECRSFDCYSVWRTTRWTECLPRCAKKGFKSRTLTCIWKRSKQPAWSSCKGKPRPTVKKTCSPRPCIEECEDKSRYCNLVGMLKMCRYSNFRYNCCGTCQEYIQRNT